MLRYIPAKAQQQPSVPLGKKKPPSLHSLIKSTHRSPITPVRGYLKSQDVYRLFPVLLTLLQGFAMGAEDQSHEMRE